MRVTANELQNVLERLPLAHKRGPDLINLAVQGTNQLRAELRVVTFRKRNFPHPRLPEWELKLV